MFFGQSFSGSSRSMISVPPVPTTVSAITFKNAIYDESYSSLAVINATTFNGAIPQEWTFDTRLHPTFKGNLYGGNVAFSEDIVESLRIKVRTKKANKFQTIYEKMIYSNEDFNIKFIDYNEPCGTIDYMCVAVISGGENQTFVNSIESKFEYHFLCERGVSYPMCLDTEVSKQLNQRVSVVETWGRRYPLIVKNSNTKYYSGNVKCTFIELGENDYKVNSAWDYRNTVYDFLTNGHPKILKDYDGNIYMISVTSEITEESDHPQHYTTSFDFSECGDAYYVGDLYDNNFIDIDLDR